MAAKPVQLIGILLLPGPSSRWDYFNPFQTDSGPGGKRVQCCGIADKEWFGNGIIHKYACSMKRALIECIGERDPPASLRCGATEAKQNLRIVECFHSMNPGMR
jgi:hypothetical protein